MVKPGPDPTLVGVLADASVDGLAEEVCVPCVATVFLEEVEEQPAQVGTTYLGYPHRHRLIEAAVRDGLGVASPGCGDRPVVEGIQLVRGLGGRPFRPLVGDDLVPPGIEGGAGQATVRRCS